jgi:hypothetical protein
MAIFEEQMRDKHVLYSYATCRSTPLPSTIAGYCLDSGAFTAWRRGTPVDIDKLVRWYDRFDRADFKLTLDVIGGTEAQQNENLRILESNGQKVTPVFHGPGLESWRWFDEMCEKYPLVAVSSVLPSNTSPQVTQWLQQLFNRICDRTTGLPKIKLHGLRMPIRMGDFPFASVDGSTWVTAAKNGAMPAGPASVQQVRAPIGMDCLDLQNAWISAWQAAPKAQTYQYTPVLFPEL